MVDDNKNSNLIIFGIAAIAAMLFGYLIYSSRNQTQPPQLQPIQLPQQIIQQPQQTIDNTLLYKLEFQSQQMADNLKLLQEQQMRMQEQQINQTEAVSQLEAAKCNNVVSMGLRPSTITQMKKLIPNKISNRQPTNKRRESEEEIANRYFGMT